MQLFSLEITGEHARIVVALLGGLVAAAGFVAGRWSDHRNRVRFRKEDLVGTSIVVEFYGVTSKSDSSDVLHIITQGGSSSIEDFFHNPDLVHHIQRTASKHPGLMRLPNPVAHRMMMDEGKDAITGLDPQANIDFVQGRLTQEDKTLFGFAAYREKNHAGNGLHDQVARLVLMVVSPALITKLADPTYIDTLSVAHAGYQPRCDRLHEFAHEWQRLEALPTSHRSTGHDPIWQITIRTAAR